MRANPCVTERQRTEMIKRATQLAVLLSLSACVTPQLQTAEDVLKIEVLGFDDCPNTPPASFDDFTVVPKS